MPFHVVGEHAKKDVSANSLSGVVINGPYFQIAERCAKVDHWKTSNQRQRWLATALTDIEPRLRKVMGYRHLPKLREALKRELKIETAKKNTSRKNVA